MVYQARTSEGTPLDSAIAEIDNIAEVHPDEMEYFEIIKGSLSHVKELHETGELTTEKASFKLFNTYFHHQSSSQDFPPLPHILRVVGDDFGIQLGVDSDKLWDLYQRSLEIHT